MRTITIIYILLLVSLNTQAQDSLVFKDIIGKWQINKVVLDTVIIFDASNDTIAIHYNFKIKGLSVDFNKKDSLEKVEEIQKQIEKFKKIFIEIKNDSTYILTKLNHNGILPNEFEDGSFVFNEQTQYLQLKKDGFFLIRRTPTIIDFKGAPKIILQFILREK
jgi:hypothetical protein